MILKWLLVAFFTNLIFINCYAQDTWAQKSDFPGQAREWAVYFSIGSVGYAGGGSFYDGTKSNYYNDFWQYNPALDKWTRKPNMGGSARVGGIGFTIGNKGFVCTGSSTGTDLWEYDTVKNVWMQRANFPGFPRSGCVAFSIGNKGFVGMGQAYSKKDSCFRDFYEYNPANDKWKKISDFPGVARWGAVGFSIGNKGYVGTGVDSSFYQYYNDFWEYDTMKDKWTQKSDIGVQTRKNAVGFNILNKGYIGFGFINNHGISNDLWEYDPSVDSWTQLSSCDASYTGFASIAFAIGKKAYVGWGLDFNGQYRNDLWEYSSLAAGIGKDKGKNNFEIFPNPNNGNFIMKSTYPLTSIEISDVEGKLLYRISDFNFNNSININFPLKNGIYFVKGISNEGISINKFIVTSQ